MKCKAVLALLLFPFTLIALHLPGIQSASAETLQIPEGGHTVPIGKDRVLCGELPVGWSVTADRHFVRATEKTSASTRTFQAIVASHSEVCAHSQSTLTLLALGPWPEIDPSSVTFYPDEGRVELKGARLEGIQLVWHAGNRGGRETCLAPVAAGKGDQCVFPLQSKLPLDTVLRWLPAQAKDGPDVVTFDPQGLPVDVTTLAIRPARFVLAQVFTAAETLDVSQGIGSVPLAHPEAVAGVDCGLARCELGDGGILVRGVPAHATQILVNVRLAPRFFVSRAEKLESSAVASFALLHCPLSVASGPPMRDAEAPHILIHMSDRCRSNARLRWSVGTEPAEVVREVRASDGDYVLLRTDQLAGGRVTVTAARADTVTGVIGSVTTPTMPPPRPQSTLELPGHGPITFIPTNRDALWLVAGVAHAHLLPLDVPGAYTIHTERSQTSLRGNRNSGGFVSLRYAYRRDDLPKAFEDVNLAVLTESVQRPIREASVPVPFIFSKSRKEPLAEFLCADAKGAASALSPGKPGRIPFFARETCHVIIHQERVLPEDGQQEVVLEIDVTKANGSKRADASLNERMVLRPGGEARVIFLKGITEEFDEVTVRLSHVIDETRYVLGGAGKQAPPSAQWTATLEGGRARLYVSLNIPAGLYRINEPAASMTLNFGVLGRITWLNRQGKEGLLGLETGVLGASLIPQQYNNSPAFPPTLVALLGLGLRVEVGQSAAVGVHLWGAYEFRSEYSFTPPNAAGPRTATHWSVLFGPSISIGNVGTNL